MFVKFLEQEFQLQDKESHENQCKEVEKEKLGRNQRKIE